MKAYGYNVSRNGTRAHKWAGDDTRRFIGRQKDPADRVFKRRARAAGKAEAKAQVEG